MCGIAGFVNACQSPADEQSLRAMCDTMIHRGPNDQGLFIDGYAGIGMRRLSVIDLHTGHQPISNESKNIWVVFNGEIYNYRELADWLVKRGHRLITTSDTEVIVHLYEELGDECVQKLRGMFAFAIWDQTRKRLFIARDRLGVKPLYYSWDGRTFVFGSELKAILAHPAVRPRLDHEGLLYYLRYSYIPDPLTIYQGIAKLPPGHVLSLTGRVLSVNQYWDGVAPHADTESLASEDDAICGLEQLLQESVELRLVSDVPIGAFLSGGVDSSVVVALMARKMTRPVTTFSIGFQEDSYDELPYARRVAKHLGTNHHELIVGPKDCALIERIVTHFDEPFGDPSAIPTYYLSRLAAEHVTVALSGDGGDELFAGYDRYRVDLDRSKFEVVPLAARRLLGWTSDVLPEGFFGKRFLRNVSLPSRQRYIESISYLGPGCFDKLLAPDLLSSFDGIGCATRIMEEHLNKAAECSWLAQIQYLDAKTYLPGDVMTKVDRMSMAHSLEAREPLLDHVLVEHVAKLPSNLKFRNGVSKYLLKRVAEKLLPMEIVHRRKQGFGVPLEYWFKGGLREYVHDVLFDSRATGRGLFRYREVANIVRLYDKGRKELATTIWMLVVLETWFRLYMDNVTPSRALERFSDVPGASGKSSSSLEV